MCIRDRIKIIRINKEIINKKIQDCNLQFLFRIRNHDTKELQIAIFFCASLQVVDLHFFEALTQLVQSPFFNPGHIASGNIQLFADFPLSDLLAAVQSVTQTDDFLFPFR